MSRARHLVRDARKRKGLSQRALAEIAGVPQSTVARIESGTLEPRVDTLEKILHAADRELESAPRGGEGVDRSLIDVMLRMTPHERAVNGVESSNNVARFLQAVKWPK